MKKKILISISTVMVLIVCAIALVACAPNTVPKYVAKLIKADKWTIEITDDGDPMIYQRNGDILYAKETAAGETKAEHYLVKEGDKYFDYSIYYKDNYDMGIELNKWTREEVPAEDALQTLSLTSELFTDMLLNQDEKFADFNEEAIIKRFEERFGEEEKKWYPKDDEGKLIKTEGYATINSGKVEFYVTDSSNNPVIFFKIELKAPKLALPADAAKLKP